MPPSPSLNVRTAELPAGGPGQPSEDRIFVTPTAVIVLDGATQSFQLERDGAWIAEQLGKRLAAGLTTDPTCNLTDLLERTLTELIEEYDLKPGSAPSTTVNIVRLNDSMIDIYVLCDSPVIVLDTKGTIYEIRDDRLAAVSTSINRPPGLPDMNDPRWIKAAEDFEALRNHPDGFWVPSATPEAARHAIERSMPAGQIDTILAMTDGASAGVDNYGIPTTWRAAIELASDEPEVLLELVQETETEDPNAERWRRTKCHDDKAIAVIQVDDSPSTRTRTQQA